MKKIEKNFYFHEDFILAERHIEINIIKGKLHSVMKSKVLCKNYESQVREQDHGNRDMGKYWDKAICNNKPSGQGRPQWNVKFDPRQEQGKIACVDGNPVCLDPNLDNPCLIPLAYSSVKITIFTC